ncbi:MAG TPA: hypothetical protein DEO85_01140 [Maritimibacter sp.]|nr:hypothetical protein [Maritimibacter sp.]
MWGIATYFDGQIWIEREAFDRILNQTIDLFADRKRKRRKFDPERDFPHDVRARALRMLNDTISVSMYAQFLQAFDFDGEQHLKDIAATVRYFETTNRFRGVGFTNYETASPELLEFLKKAVNGGEWPATDYRPHRSKEHWERTFYSEALGLFFALFDEVPTATIDLASTADDFNVTATGALGPTMWFMRQVILGASDCQTAVRFRRTTGSLGVSIESWDFHSETALQNKINLWKKHPPENDEASKRWREVGRGYQAGLQELRENTRKSRNPDFL